MNATEAAQGFLIRWVVRSVIGVVIVAAILFGAAGSMAWPMGWAFLAVLLIVPLVTAGVVDRDLLEERERVKTSDRAWDRIIFGLFSLIPVVIVPLIAGFDRRYGWSGGIALWLQVAALLVTILGWGIHVWAMAANRFFALVARIQEDRGQTVATGGPYHIVRHPGYVGGILATAAPALLLGSWWALVPGIFGAILLIIRTALEDRMLQEELEGYQAYARQVPHRLIPGVW
jgi:protein-S-isoprenylcysteine O-methyltransferase Ste14